MEAGLPDERGELVEELEKTIAELDALQSRRFEFGFAAEEAPDVIGVFSNALKLTLAVAARSMGECQMDVPYSPMHPVRTPDGEMLWCCNHTPRHC